MGAISSRLTRQFYRFNAENRAQKIFKSNEPRPAPKHEKTLKQIDMLEKEMPSLKDDLAKFDPNLHDRLKQIYVTASDVTPAQNVFTKPPRLSHKVRRTSDFGFDDNETASHGHISLKHTLRMIMTYYKEDDCKIEDLAKKYKIKTKDAENILKYYQCFNLNLPRGKFETEKYLNLMMFGNELGEVLTSEQFIKRLEDQKGIRDGLTKGIPMLNADILALEEEERKKRAISSGAGKKTSVAKEIKSSDQERKD